MPDQERETSACRRCAWSVPRTPAPTSTVAGWPSSAGGTPRAASGRRSADRCDGRSGEWLGDLGLPGLGVGALTRISEVGLARRAGRRAPFLPDPPLDL